MVLAVLVGSSLLFTSGFAHNRADARTLVSIDFVRAGNDRIGPAALCHDFLVGAGDPDACASVDVDDNPNVQSEAVAFIRPHTCDFMPNCVWAGPGEGRISISCTITVDNPTQGGTIVMLIREHELQGVDEVTPYCVTPYNAGDTFGPVTTADEHWNWTVNETSTNLIKVDVRDYAPGQWPNGGDWIRTAQMNFYATWIFDEDPTHAFDLEDPSGEDHYIGESPATGGTKYVTRDAAGDDILRIDGNPVNVLNGVPIVVAPIRLVKEIQQPGFRWTMEALDGEPFTAELQALGSGRVTVVDSYEGELEPP